MHVISIFLMSFVILADLSRTQISMDNILEGRTCMIVLSNASQTTLGSVLEQD